LAPDGRGGTAPKGSTDHPPILADLIGLPPEGGQHKLSTNPGGCSLSVPAGDGNGCWSPEKAGLFPSPSFVPPGIDKSNPPRLADDLCYFFPPAFRSGSVSGHFSLKWPPQAAQDNNTSVRHSGRTSVIRDEAPRRRDDFVAAVQPNPFLG
jgi:hypothetical protein